MLLASSMPVDSPARGLSYYHQGRLSLRIAPMISSRIKLSAALVMAVTFTPAYAATVIHFTGQVVEDPCVISPASHTISVTCPQNTKMHTQQVSYSDALYGAAVTDRAAISMKYINPEKSLAIVQVDYR
ncbi:MAG: type 1 fimbrial protein [Leclercia adecarboxylata]|nr:type 1 fimbrial protein [uncultured Leclercia sp.]MDU4841734.1 type 1 fimbrial protein [Leclercia adecarboxylata]